MNIIVIGAGLAGAACAYALTQRGYEVTCIAQGGGASELPVGLLAAHLSARDIELSQLSRIGVEITLSHARSLLREGLDWQPRILQQKLLFSPEKNARLRHGAANLPAWYEPHINHVLHKTAAWIKPQALVKAWLAQPGITLQTATVATFKRVKQQWQAFDAQGHLIAQAPAIVLAGGAQIDALLAQCGHAMLMDVVSGSVALGDWPSSSSVDGATTGSPFDTPSQQAPVVNGNGHFISGVPLESGKAIWLSGSTYEREAHTSAAELTQASLQANLSRLSKLLPAALLPAIQAQFDAAQVQSWQGSRCTTSDRLPIVGKLDDGLYVCTAMGSRGLSFAALCAEILAFEIMPDCTSSPVAAAIDQPHSLTISTALRELLRPHRPTLRI